MLYKRGVMKNLSKFTDKHKKQSFAGILAKLTENRSLAANSRLQTWNCQKQQLEMFCKKDIFKNFVNFTGKHVCWSHFLTKLHLWRRATLLKKTPTKMLSSEICKIFKNIILKNICEQLKFILKRTPVQMFSCELCELF